MPENRAVFICANIPWAFMKPKAIAVLTAFLAIQPATVHAATHPITVSRHANVSISNTDVDGYLKDGSDRLKKDDDGAPGITDVACDVTLVRSGSVAQFQNGGPATINSNADKALVHSEPTLVKVVTAINTCGGTAGSVNGCSISPGRSIIVIRTTADTAGTWVHEFGHTPGLGHSQDKKAIMYEASIAGQNRVTAAECTGFTSGPPSALAQSQTELSEIDSSQHAGQDLKDFILSGFAHRVPWNSASAYRGADLTPAHQMLFETRYAASWGTAATVLGIVGSEDTVSVLLRFLRDAPDGADIQLTRLAVNNALLALGYLANRLDSEDALSALQTYSETRAWSDQGNWLGVTPAERDQVAQDLSEVALMGLAFSGRPQALEELKDSPDRLAASKGPDRNAAFLTELRQLHSDISERGLDTYYAD